VSIPTVVIVLTSSVVDTMDVDQAGNSALS
jgi:hypothetical protein